MASDKFYQWMTKYPDGTNGPIGVLLPGLGHQALQSSRLETVKMMEVYAKSHGEKSGQKVWLRTWTWYDDDEPVTPEVTKTGLTGS